MGHLGYLAGASLCFRIYHLFMDMRLQVSAKFQIDPKCCVIVRVNCQISSGSFQQMRIKYFVEKQGGSSWFMVVRSHIFLHLVAVEYYLYGIEVVIFCCTFSVAKLVHYRLQYSM